MMPRMETPPWYVLTGGPCTGKTTTILEFERRGYSVLPEPARMVIAEELAAGKTIQEITADAASLERAIVTRHIELESNEPKNQTLFLDRGIPDNIAYYRKAELPIDEYFQHAIDSVRYRKIFLLDMIDYSNDAERYESPEEARQLHEGIRQAYEELGYEIVRVPVMPVSERVDFILTNL